MGTQVITRDSGRRLGVVGEVIVDIDRREIERARIQWPFFRDRRVDAYGGLCSRFGDE